MTSPLTNRLRSVNRTYALTQSDHGAIRQAAVVLDAICDVIDAEADDAHERVRNILLDAGLVPHD